jgi:hypothetical protein
MAVRTRPQLAKATTREGSNMMRLSGYEVGAREGRGVGAWRNKYSVAMAMAVVIAIIVSAACSPISMPIHAYR